MSVTGIEETVALLEGLDAKVARTILRKGLRAAGKVVQARAKADAPVRSGKIGRLVKVRSGGNRNGVSRITIGVSRADFPADEWYGPAEIFGHRVGGRVKKGQRLSNATGVSPANDFLNRALVAEKDAAVETMARVWRDEIAAATGGN